MLKAVSKFLTSLSHSRPSRIDVYHVYPTVTEKKRSHTKTAKAKGPTKARMESIDEEPQSDGDGQHDDEGAAQPHAPDFRADPYGVNLEEKDLDVDQIGDSDDEIPDQFGSPRKSKDGTSSLHTTTPVTLQS